MRQFLVTIVIIAPILVTATALGYVSLSSRRYTDAEDRLIARLQDFSQQELAEYKGAVKRFLEDPGKDLTSLARTIEFVTGVAVEALGSDAKIIVRILRGGSDYNKARYLDMLFGKIDPRWPPRPPYKQDDPDRPGPSSAAALETARSREPAT